MRLGLGLITSIFRKCSIEVSAIGLIINDLAPNELGFALMMLIIYLGRSGKLLLLFALFGVFKILNKKLLFFSKYLQRLLEGLLWLWELILVRQRVRQVVAIVTLLLIVILSIIELQLKILFILFDCWSFMLTFTIIIIEKLISNIHNLFLHAIPTLNFEQFIYFHLVAQCLPHADTLSQLVSQNVFSYF